MQTPEGNISSGNLDAFQAREPGSRGWFIGHFINAASNFHSNDFEVKWSRHPLGDKREIPSKGNVKTLAVLIEGKFKISLPETNQEFELKAVGDYVYYGEGVSHTWESLQENSCVLAIRWPSVPQSMTATSSAED